MKNRQGNKGFNLIEDAATGKMIWQHSDPAIVDVGRGLVGDAPGSV
ncbi:hypothetical protein GCM10010435_25420 [Winogradskya consettensis]|uniref:Uncharacterized protein n=1 Tax=Winogradskya consettensis TaxID=113560 RepID=A0A919VLI4_9ACTN|nr:hypothetical protein [Actinoplanes consettensis]GIM67876.1 hypothetical protein Aco04nite_08210 [Actinoplanes consettensis]